MAITVLFIIWTEIAAIGAYLQVAGFNTALLLADGYAIAMQDGR